MMGSADIGSRGGWWNSYSGSLRRWRYRNWLRLGCEGECEGCLNRVARRCLNAVYSLVVLSRCPAQNDCCGKKNSS